MKRLLGLTRMHAFAILLTLMLMTTWAACGVGRPIVDSVSMPPADSPPPPSCEPTSCEEPTLHTLSERTPTELAVIDQATCASNAHELIDDSSALDHANVSCKQLRVELPNVPGECAMNAVELKIEHAVLSIRAKAGCSVTLSALQAFDTQIWLEGPLSVRIEAESELRRVGFVGIANEYGEPSLMLDATSAHQVVIGDDAQPFEGAVNVRSSFLEDSLLVVSSGVLETTLFDATRLDASSLTTSDAFFEHSMLDVGSAVLSAGRLETSEVRSCDTLSIIDMSLLNAALRGCGARPYRIFEGSIGSSTIDGFAEIDTVRISGARFGVNVDSDVVMHAGGVHASAFCEHARTLRYGDDADVKCSSCIAGSDFEADGVCVLPGANLTNESMSYCAAFDMEPLCPQPYPERVRDRHRLE